MKSNEIYLYKYTISNIQDKVPYFGLSIMAFEIQYDFIFCIGAESEYANYKIQKHLKM